MLLNCGVREDSWESLGLQGDPTSPSWGKSALNIHWKDWCWCWNSNTLATWPKNRLKRKMTSKNWEELTPWKRPWCWERLKVGGEGDARGWDDWMSSLTQWTWVWVNSGSWWWTGRPGVLQSMGSQRVRHDWVTELTELNCDVSKQLRLFFFFGKSLQSSLILFDPMGCSPPGSSVHGDSPGKNTRMSWHFLLQEIFQTQESNPRLLCLLHWKAGSLSLVLPGKPHN